MRPILIFPILLAPAACLPQSRPAAPAPASSVATAERLPVDPQVKIGTLENGLRYYVRVNRRPEQRAELRLVVRVGSVLEDEDQLGLAHFLEHMAFNGTRNFERNELVHYLERVGMRFGPDLNAYTSFDETVYMLQIPTDSAGIVRTAVQILEDWAHGLTLDHLQVERERGVVLEEWRLGRGAGARMMDQQLPVLLQGSQYARRLPIGTRESLESFDARALERFYRDWYRPDLMAVVAVGDFDPAVMETLIRDQFSRLRAPSNPRARPRFDVPLHDSTLVTIATDPEATGTSVSVYHKQPERDRTAVASYRQSLVERLFNAMLNERFQEITQKPDSPFLGAYSAQGSFIGPTEAYLLGAGVKEGGVIAGLEAALIEAARVEQHGFTPPELDRVRRDMLRGMERAFAERETSNSAGFAAEYVQHFLEGEPIPGVAHELELVQRFLPTIQVGEVNRLAREWLGTRSRVVTVNAPYKAEVPPPTREQLLDVIDGVRNRQVAAYEESDVEGPLMETLPTPGSIVREEKFAETGVTRWTLSNGARVLVKSTDFRADQVLFSAYSAGGTSLLPDSLFAAAQFAGQVVVQGGVGRFSQVELNRALAGRAVSVTPFIGATQVGLSGSASPRELEDLFQLLHLWVTAPRVDSTAVLALTQQVRDAIANREASPESVFADSVQVITANRHHRARPLSRGLIDSIDLGHSADFYRARFSRAGNFTFAFVGNVNVDSLKPLVERYIASLPAGEGREKARDVGMRPPEGVVTRTVRMGSEPKATTQMLFHGDLEWSRERAHALRALRDLLEIRLREVVREELAGTYGVSVSADLSREPVQRYAVGINFGAAPEQVDSLSRVVLAQIDSVKRTGATADEVARIREIQRRDQERGLRENGYWISRLLWTDMHGLEPGAILDTERLRAAISPESLRETARVVLDSGRMVRITLLPQD